MSRAFVKELDEDRDVGELPDKPQSPHINYVTPKGLERLQERVRELSAARAALAGRDDLEGRQQLKHLERELRFFGERVKRAVLVRPDAQPPDRVHFGVAVEVAEADNAGARPLRFVIVGEDEAEAAQGRISWTSPLARALLNARVGDTVTWRRPAGDKELEIIAIDRD